MSKSIIRNKFCFYTTTVNHDVLSANISNKNILHDVLLVFLWSCLCTDVFHTHQRLITDCWLQLPLKHAAFLNDYCKIAMFLKCYLINKQVLFHHKIIDQPRKISSYINVNHLMCTKSFTISLIPVQWMSHSPQYR